MAWTKRQWRESEVNRDRRGRFAHKPRGSKAIEAVKATGRRLAGMEDRTGPRLRWGEKGTRGWWYVPRGSAVKGAPYWVRRQPQPTVIGEYYYRPDRWYPVVPPREMWPHRGAYNGIPGQTGLSSAVPSDVWQAAQSDAMHTRSWEDPSPRVETLNWRRTRAGLGEETKHDRRIRAAKVTRRPRRTR